MEKLVTVTTFINTNEAYIAKGLLESKGIQSWVFDEHASTYVPFREVRLVVMLSDLEEVRKVLSL